LVEVGIAEQNLVGITAGLAAAGKKPFGVSPACFLTARSLEQIKNDVCYSDVPATLVGISAGVSYGALGSTHHSLHDFAALRAIHNISIVAPADNFETRAAARAAATSEKPMYLRFGKAATYSLHNPETRFEPGKSIMVRDGHDAALIATGEVVIHALLAAGQLARRGIACRVISMHTVKPLDVEAVLKAGRECRAHPDRGGTQHPRRAGRGVRSRADAGPRTVPFRIIGIPDEETVTGSQADIFRHYGISMEGLSETVMTTPEADMSLILALDQSTSATKAVLFDAVGTVIDTASRDHRQIYPQPGWVEHDAEEIWGNTLAVIAMVASRNADRLADLAAISITNQRETVLVFDRKTGRPLHNAIVWQCRRGDALCQSLREQDCKNVVRRKTGLKIDTYFLSVKNRVAHRGKAGHRRKAARWQRVIGTMDTYLIHRLTGGAVFATDFTNASRTLLFDIGALRWDEELCKPYFASRPARLPEVRESAAQYRRDRRGGHPAQARAIAGVMGDSQASLFAQRCHHARHGEGHLRHGHERALEHRRGIQAREALARSRRSHGYGGANRFTHSKGSSLSPLRRLSGSKTNSS
jgi:transketolase